MLRHLLLSMNASGRIRNSRKRESPPCQVNLLLNCTVNGSGRIIPEILPGLRRRAAHRAYSGSGLAAAKLWPVAKSGANVDSRPANHLQVYIAAVRSSPAGDLALSRGTHHDAKNCRINPFSTFIRPLLRSASGFFRHLCLRASVRDRRRAPQSAVHLSALHARRLSYRRSVYAPPSHDARYDFNCLWRKQSRRARRTKLARLGSIRCHRNGSRSNSASDYRSDAP